MARSGSMRIGTLDRIPIDVHWTWPLAAVVTLATHSYALLGALGCIVGFTLVVLVHELGHAALVRAFREHVLALTFYAWGGECTFTDTQLSPLRYSVIATGGVLGQATLLGVTRYVVGDRTAFGNAFLDGFVFALFVPNVLMMAFNLLPVRPLDGYLVWQLPYQALRTFAVKRRPRPIPSTPSHAPRRSRGSLRVVRGGKDE